MMLLFTHPSFTEKDILSSVPNAAGMRPPLYVNPDAHSRKVHEQALTGMFGEFCHLHLISVTCTNYTMLDNIIGNLCVASAKDVLSCNPGFLIIQILIDFGKMFVST